MAAFKVLLSSVTITALVFVNFCSSTDQSVHFSTKTAYRWVHSDIDASYTEDDLSTLSEIEGKSCSVAHTTVVARHGTRFPGFDDVQDIIELHEKLVAAMEPDVNPDLYNWKNKFPSNNNKVLSHVGEEELEDFGTRVAKRLATLFADEDMSNFRFITSSQERTKQSASAFFEGFIKTIQTEEESDDFDSEVNDELMRFFDLCARYVYDVKDNKIAMKEYHSFMDSEHIVKVRDKVAKKLGVSSDIISTAYMRLIHVICGYEKATFDKSPWCSLFDAEDMISLEYLGDLKHYYKNGHGHNITWLQSCPLISEIFSTMDDVIMEIENTEEDEEIEGYLVGQFAFGHAETVGPLLSALGLYNDSEPLRADNFLRHGDRAFRSSKILPFGANVMFLLYECVPEDVAEEDEIDQAEYFLKLLVNEKPVVIPGCSQVHCSYTDVRSRYEHLVDECNFKKLCKRKTPKDEL